METANLKSIWQGMSTPQKDKEELNLMLKKNSHPILAAIKKQIIVELIGFIVFLFCYFSMFDGATKPLGINLFIITTILLQLFYGYKGYLMRSKFKSSTNLNDDLENFTIKLKSYRHQVILARTLFAVGLLIFFSYNIHFSASKISALAFIVVIFSVQLWVLYRVWSKRISRLELVLEEFKI